MNAFDYAAPTRIEDAVKLLGEPESAALSGGTDLLGRLKDEVSAPKRVVYLKDIKPLAGISGDASSGLTLGAGTPLAQVLESKAVKEGYPALWQSTLEVGTPQIRNMATVGGNLLQRPRCWYFHAGNGLLGMKDGKSLVREGDNRYHAIFMTSGDALFVNPSSLAVPLIALEAKAVVAGPKGERTVPVEELYQVPKSDKDSELTVGPGELLTKIMIPPARGKNASYEVRQKQAHDWPLVMASVNLRMDGDNVASSRVVLYGVAPVPYRCEAAEAAIAGKAVTTETASAAGEAATTGAAPLSMNGYKVALTKTSVKRALLAAIGKPYWEF
ncbi:4-hydroxybenzoyl-CoA reductase subunit beta [Aquisphaera giovannonii]|uniref:4-hydroxybenzoyl-CoA reductase subunit beta n=1 Tax=Aquisphaera giovannonii TaxID=406548 RepID=A0A5B9VWH2_9BACT|nr:FAD binding domain-containing protein [Aquisphaera giovannonii]QEH32733.1 4-hydroxybenzoyl-CoA reductase subunit beta [Aquisphaera giovannonii]